MNLTLRKFSNLSLMDKIELVIKDHSLTDESIKEIFDRNGCACTLKYVKKKLVKQVVVSFENSANVQIMINFVSLKAKSIGSVGYRIVDKSKLKPSKDELAYLNMTLYEIYKSVSTD